MTWAALTLFVGVVFVFSAPSPPACPENWRFQARCAASLPPWACSSERSRLFGMATLHWTDKGLRQTQDLVPDISLLGSRNDRLRQPDVHSLPSSGRPKGLLHEDGSARPPGILRIEGVHSAPSFTADRNRDFHYMALWRSAGGG